MPHRERQRTSNERQKRKAPIRKNPHERLTIKGLRIGSKTKISRFGLQDKSFDKTSANKTKSPTLPTKYPAWYAGLRQSSGFFMPPKRQSLKSRAEPPTGNVALYKGRSLSNIRPNALLREARWICRDNYTTNRAKRKAADPKACRFNALHKKTHPIKSIVSHIQYFINAFQPVSYRCPAVMCLRCNVRQREPLNVPQ